MERNPFDKLYFEKIFQCIQDGIIIMDQTRHILLMNPSAERLTGWKLHDTVPYCSFCQTRSLTKNENKCYLIQNNEVPYFLSEMPTYHGKKINVEMSTALMFQDKENGKKEYLLVLRDQSLKQKEEEARQSKRLIKKLIEAKEDEHKRLAQELHDGIGQSLFSISVALQAIETHVKDERLHTYVGEVRSELDQAMNDVKSYSYQLRPQSLDRLGFIPTVRSLISTHEKTNPAITISFQIKGYPYRFHQDIEINLYRVVQEALHNIVKYAQATSVSIFLDTTEEVLTLTIIDNGIGFELDQLKNKGLGLKHMSERIEQVDGKLTIQSKIQNGTIIEAKIPNWKESNDD